MLTLARNGYTAAEVQAALHSASRKLSFRYRLLDQNNQFLRNIDTVLECEISYSSMQQIKRTARFRIKDDGSIDYLRHRIMPVVLLRMPDGGHAEFPVGVFILSTPPRKTDGTGVVVREVEAYDLGQVLADDRIESRYTVPAGTNVVQAVSEVLASAGITQQNLAPSDKVLPADRDWIPGTDKATIVDDLLSSINYRPLWFDETGRAVSGVYVSPSEAAAEYTYADDELSVLAPEVEQSLDMFAIPNKWVLFVSEPDRLPMVTTRVNNNPNSPTSTVNRGRTIVDFQWVDVVDQETLEALADRIMSEASQVYEHIEFETALMPIHSHSDVLRIRYRPLGIDGKYVETRWSMTLKAGSRMKHEARRVVTV